jgi:putative oxidoreductase
MIRLPRPAMWALVILLMAVFVRVGTSKLLGPSATGWSERFVRWGYPAAAAGLIGILELASGLALLIPKVRRAAAATIVGLMIGALFTHLVNGEFVRLIPPLVLGALAILVYTSRRTP